MTTSTPTRATAAEAGGGLLVPPPAGEPGRSWRRLVTGVDHGKKGGFAFDGVKLVPGAVYRIDDGGLVIVVDVADGLRHVRLLKVVNGAWKQVNEWQPKAIGTRIITYIARRLPDRPVRRAERVDEPPNRWAGPCHRCDQEVPAGEGKIARVLGQGRLVHAEVCPPRPPRANDRDAACVRCGGWVRPGQGHLIVLPPRDLAEALDPRWAVHHLTG
jgi:hypothetical protein